MSIKSIIKRIQINNDINNKKASLLSYYYTPLNIR